MAVQWPFSQITQEMASMLYDNHHEGILMCDREGRIVYYNRRLGELDNLDPAEVVGHHILDVYSLDRENCISSRCLATARPIINEALYYRATRGNLVNAICNAHPIFENGRLVGNICYTAEYTSMADRLDKTARNYARHPYSRAIDPEPTKTAANGAVHTLASIVGESPVIQAALETAKVGARSPSSVLIYGETGTGKELFAQAVHNHSPRRARLFCPINCAAIPENLLEGILFGTVKGAFTGAMERKGLFEVASGGTIFLDELHAMPMGLQAKLLRVIQERRIRRVGSLDETSVDLKIISSLNMRPEDAVEKGLLRPDLFYRLGVVTLALPPLRNRPADITGLVKHFVKKYNKSFSGQVKHIEPEFLSIMFNYGWPGNVRELEHVVETSMNFAVGDPINNKSLGLRHIQSAHLRRFLMRREPKENQGAPTVYGSVNRPGKVNTLPDEVAQTEKELLASALAQNEGHMARAARQLGISRQALYYKLKKYRISG